MILSISIKSTFSYVLNHHTRNPDKQRNISSCNCWYKPRIFQLKYREIWQFYVEKGGSERAVKRILFVRGRRASAGKELKNIPFVFHFCSATFYALKYHTCFWRKLCTLFRRRWRRICTPICWVVYWANPSRYPLDSRTRCHWYISSRESFPSSNAPLTGSIGDSGESFPRKSLLVASTRREIPPSRARIWAEESDGFFRRSSGVSRVGRCWSPRSEQNLRNLCFWVNFNCVYLEALQVGWFGQKVREVS